MAFDTKTADVEERIEDGALLSGSAQFIDDLPFAVGTLHAAILRSPHAHASIVSIDGSRARALPGVAAGIDGTALAKVSEPLMIGVKIPIKCWPMAVDRARYVVLDD